MVTNLSFDIKINVFMSSTLFWTCIHSTDFQGRAGKRQCFLGTLEGCKDVWSPIILVEELTE